MSKTNMKFRFLAPKATILLLAVVSLVVCALPGSAQEEGEKGGLFAQQLAGQAAAGPPGQANPFWPHVAAALGGNQNPAAAFLNALGFTSLGAGNQVGNAVGQNDPVKRENVTPEIRDMQTQALNLSGMTGQPTGELTSAAQAVNNATSNAQKAALEGRTMQNAQAGQAGAAGAATEGADVAGEIGHDMAETAISYTSTYLHNFTVEGGNRWNQIRNNIFVPMGILLLLPGAVLSQVRAIMAAGNPVLGQVNPFDGILRSFVAIFLIPGTYLVVNYGIDLANSITHTIADEYTRMFGSDMYRDAICHEIKCMPWRLPEENRNTIDIPVSSMGVILLGNATPFAQLEADLIAVKIYDPCAGIYIVPPDRANEAVPAAVMAARLMANSSNASLVTSWSILCAFQLAYLYYLWCVGPVVAGLWVWPMKHLRDALPNWVEGVITVCFWALFWNTIVLLIACFRGVDETGTIIMLALNTLANLTVKFAFDFAGMVRAAGGEAMKLGEKMAQAIEKSGKG
ncbi:MAG: hypothetical protein SGJ27_07235, partial [Candidatus Melainabacteria bacterium]|nr:hypothetical protein [Candidatus Melainabacteria bacterium]